MANIFYLIGASGVGKDSLLDYARRNARTEHAVIFAHRYITRPADAGGENHIALTEEEFARRRDKGCFAMSWYSHANWYGVGVEIEQWLAMGNHVVVNGSRAYLEQAAQRYPQLIPVLVRADSEQLRQRLQQRGRETVEQIEKRLQQALLLDQQVDHPQLVRVENNGQLAEAGQQLLDLIQGR